MIRYNNGLTPKSWRDLVESESPGWLDKAATRTAELLALPAYEAGSPSWSAIKGAFMGVQGYKCGFCERRLEKSRFGRIEHDIEHFRPKKKVSAWPTPAVIASRQLVGYTVPIGADGDGYRALALNIENYLISCKTCNSTLKSNSFPMLYPGAADSQSPRDLMRSEKPLLLYPLGTVDPHKPEDVITFRGVMPIPTASRGYKRQRGKTTIDFFALAEREVLIEERAETILALYLAAHGLISNRPQVAAVAETMIDALTSPASPHANCARTFHDLMHTDMPTADRHLHACREYLNSRAIIGAPR